MCSPHKLIVQTGHMQIPSCISKERITSENLARQLECPKVSAIYHKKLKKMRKQHSAQSKQLLPTHFLYPFQLAMEPCFTGFLSSISSSVVIIVILLKKKKIRYKKKVPLGTIQQPHAHEKNRAFLGCELGTGRRASKSVR